MKIRWTTPAARQLTAVYEFIAAEDPRAAGQMVERIGEAVEMLGRHPKAGRKGRVADTRELVVVGTPFVVVYFIGKNEIQVWAVLHAARKWPEEF